MGQASIDSTSTYQPSIDRKQVRELAGLSFVERAQNAVLLGPPGVDRLERRLQQFTYPKLLILDELGAARVGRH